MFSLDLLTTVGLAWGLVAVLMAVLWVIQRSTGNAGIVDVGWAAGLGFVAVLYALFLADGSGMRRVLVAAMAGAWSLRLTLYLYVRVVGHPEDGRYLRLRKTRGDGIQSFFLVFFQAQGLLIVILAIPFLVAILNPRDIFGGLELAALLIWFVSVLGEAVADRQLMRFKADASNRGKTCRSGLWRYSRHPNYFFQSLFWWSFVMLGVGSTYWYLTLIGPVVVTFLILKVTGIPPTEAQAIETRGDDYRDYQRTTSVFVPWFPRERSRV